MKKGTVDEIVARDLCCGCGVCAAGCPTDAIGMGMSADRELQPTVDPATCIECPICLRICPFDERNLAHQCQEAVTRGAAYGVPEGSWIYRGYQVDEERYLKSASGGVLSALQSFLLQEGRIDCVIHAEPVFGTSDDLLFQASISRSAEEIDAKRSSFYYPIEFSKALEAVAADDTVSRVCFTGIPCAVTGVENLTRVMKALREKMWGKLALVCGHSVSGQFADILTRAFPRRDEKRAIDFRSKVGITAAENFNIEMRFESGDSLRQSRLQNPFTRNWRTYSYALNACFSCPDFWGAHADASFKDAWGFGEGERKEGESVIVVRTGRVREALEEMAARGLVRLRTVERQRAMLSQWESVEFKTMDIRHRIGAVVPGGVKSRPDAGLADRLLHAVNYRLKRFNMKASKWLLRRHDRPVPTWISRLLATAMWYLAGVKRVLTKLREVRRADGPGLSVVYTAGFGYGNLGDEAQLASNLVLWRELAPGSRLTLLSPRPVYTRRVHPGTEVIPASRRTFWGLLGVDYFGIGGSRLFLLPFLCKYALVLLNALLVRWFGKTLLMSPHSAGLLQRLAEADVLHIGGGGYLTGKTPSRLYDYMALIRVARLLGTDVILSGQNIGVWQNRLQRWFARNLRRAELIGLRDETASVADLERAGVEDRGQIHILFDDALFCPPASEERLAAYLEDRGVNRRRGLLAVNVHYWLVERARVDAALEAIALELERLRKKHDLTLIYVPMVRTDREAIDRLAASVGGSGHVLEAGDDFALAIAAIQAARLCITMKHHPIVFAMAGGVPTISLYFEDYYRHKNEGAMGLFGQQGCSLDAAKLEPGELEQSAGRLLARHEEVRAEILSRLEELKPKRGEIIRQYLRARGLMGDAWEDWEEVDVSALQVRGL